MRKSLTALRTIVVLSGPSHAEEVIRKQPTTVVVASSEYASSRASAGCSNKHGFPRLYESGRRLVSRCQGAQKYYRTGAGLSDGLKFGDNATAVLLTRGFEIGRLGTAMGANPLTFAGLAGVGDLVVTCTSKHSRNWSAGYMLADGSPLEEVLTNMGMVVEGVKTTRAAYELAKQFDVEMPITSSFTRCYLRANRLEWLLSI